MQKAFPLFAPHQDLGFCTWTPGPAANQSLKQFKETTVADITSRIDLADAKDDDSDLETMMGNLSVAAGSKGSAQFEGPPKLKIPMRVPGYFEKNLPAQEYPNSFPNEAGYVVPLCVAVRRGLVLSDIDFVLGGSGLEVLANKRIERRTDLPDNTKYLVQRVENVIVLAKSKRYVANYADTGFQFERLVTGGRLDGKHDPTTSEHLHIMKLGKFKVLFAAEVDAVDDEGKCVEIKSGNPRYFGTKVMLQMLSSGSQTLIQADKRGPKLIKIKKRSISDLIREHPTDVLRGLQDNILEVLAVLKSADTKVISDEFPTELDFEGKKVVLKPCPEGDLLPKKQVVTQLLELAAAAHAGN